LNDAPPLINDGLNVVEPLTKGEPKIHGGFDFYNYWTEFFRIPLKEPHSKPCGILIPPQAAVNVRAEINEDSAGF
jgi:hypothetical protein